jgi:hypothetical protein
MQYIRDMIFVRSLERHIGRSLTKQELLREEIEGEFSIEFPKWTSGMDCNSASRIPV